MIFFLINSQDKNLDYILEKYSSWETMHQRKREISWDLTQTTLDKTPSKEVGMDQEN